MFGKQQNDLGARRRIDDLELEFRKLEKRVHFIEHPEEKEKERMKELQQRINDGALKVGFMTFPYQEIELQRFAKELADYYTKKAGDLSCSD